MAHSPDSIEENTVSSSSDLPQHQNLRSLMKTHLAYLTGLLSLLPFTGWTQSAKEILYVGTYTTRGSQGIYAFEFDRARGTLKPLQSASELKNPTFLTTNPSGNELYAVSETGPSGLIGAYSIDKKTGKLRFLNQQSSHGDGPCYVSVNQTGKLAFAANYGGGSIAVLPVLTNGSIGAATDSVQYSGSGPNKERQEKPHAHSIVVSPDSRYVYASDLGTDKVYTYAIDEATQKVKPAQTPYTAVAPGSGPRHLTFHPNGRYAYLVEELVSSVAVFAYDKETGALRLLEDKVKALPADFTGNNTSADIHIDPAGKFLYLSNRGHNSLAIFSIANDGRIKLTGHEPTGGKTPRNFLVDKRGEFVLVANQDSDNITMFKRDAKTGKLTPTGSPIQVPAPVCLVLTTLK